MTSKLEEVTEKILESEKLSEELKSKKNIDDVIAFYQSMDSSLSEEDILDYFCEVLSIGENIAYADDMLENVCGGRSTATSKLLASTLGAFTAIAPVGFNSNAGAKGLDGVKSTITSASQTVKSGFEKFGRNIKNKWNSLSKKQKIAIAATAGTVATAAVGLSIYGAIKYNKDKKIPKPGEKQPGSKLANPTPSGPRINIPKSPAVPIAEPISPTSNPAEPIAEPTQRTSTSSELSKDKDLHSDSQHFDEYMKGIHQKPTAKDTNDIVAPNKQTKVRHLSDKQNLVNKNLDAISNNNEICKEDKIAQSIQKLKNAGVDTGDYNVQGCIKAIGNGSVSEYFKKEYAKHVRAQQRSKDANAVKNASTFDAIAAGVKEKVRKTSPKDDSWVSSRVLTKEEARFFEGKKQEQGQRKLQGLNMDDIAHLIPVEDDSSDDEDNSDWD